MKSNLVKFDYLCALWISPEDIHKFCVRIFTPPNCLAQRAVRLVLISSKDNIIREVKLPPSPLKHE